MGCTFTIRPCQSASEVQGEMEISLSWLGHTEWREETALNGTQEDRKAASLDAASLSLLLYFSRPWKFRVRLF
jgi:hypothetical protein